jgi:hypothetical protein
MHQRARVRRDYSRWSAMRNIIVSIYQPSHLTGLIPTVESCIERAATNLAEGKEIAFSELALSLATDGRHRAGGFRCRLRPVQRASVASAGRRRSRGEGSVGVHQHAHLLDHVAQDGHVGVALCNRWHARPLLAEAVAAAAPCGFLVPPTGRPPA